MMRLTKLAWLVALGLSASGCGGGGGGDEPSKTTTYSKKVVVETVEASSNELGFLTDATVCLDVDQDSACGANDIVATTDSQGRATLSWDSEHQAAIGNGTGLQVLAFSADGSQSFALPMSAPTVTTAGRAATSTTELSPLYINSVSNLIYSYALSNNVSLTEAATQVKALIGYDGDISELLGVQLQSEDVAADLRNFAIIIGRLGYVDFTDKSVALASELSMFADAYASITSSLFGLDDMVTAALKYYVELRLSIIFSGPEGLLPTPNTQPESEFDFSRNGLTVSFVSQASDAETASDELIYRWWFGDEAKSSATDRDPVFTYAAAGSYLVRLRVTDAGGLSRDSYQLITVASSQVENQLPVALFDVSVSEQTARFSNRSTDADGDTLTYAWDFAGLGSSTEVNPSFTFPTASTTQEYQVTLTVNDGQSTQRYSKTVSIAGVAQQIPVADFSFMVEGPAVSFTATATDDSAADALSYAWDFGDGTTAQGVTVSHTYGADGDYSVSLVVTDPDGNQSVAVSRIVQLDSQGRCTPVCTSEEVCTASSQVTRQLAATQTSLAPTSVTASSVTTSYHATNPNGQLGQYKTISRMSDWTTDMIVAQSAANDDPRAYRGGHEKATDFYALYAAWDESNLYLMVEMPNLDGATACGDFDYACDQFLPMGIGLRTGKRVPGNGLLVSGTNVWTQGNFYTIEEGIDTLLLFHPRLPTVNTPGLFFTNADGLFSYDSAGGYLLGFDKAGISRQVESGHVSPAYYGIAARDGRTAADYLNSGSYGNLLTGNASGRLYQVTIPLATLGVTRSDIETTGLGVMAFSTFGESMMDALPWTPNLVDVASEAYSKDSSTSQEKEDSDAYDVPLARIGNLTGALGDIIIPEPKPEPDPICVTQQVCTAVPSDCYVEYSLSPHAEVIAGEDETSSTIVYQVSVESPIGEASYQWFANDQLLAEGATATLTFRKGVEARDQRISVTASDRFAIKTGTGELSLTIPASANQVLEGGVLTGEVMDDLPLYNVSACQYAAPASGLGLLLHVDSSTVPNIWAYASTTVNYTQSGKWPGDAMTPVSGCEQLYSYAIPQADSAKVIFSGVAGDARYPADMQPGIDVSEPACFDWDSKQLVDISACLGTPDPTLKVYTTLGEEGGLYTFKYDAERGTGAYLDIPLIIYGEGVDANTVGTVTVNGTSSRFTNGEILRLGEQLAAADVAAGETPTTLEVTLSYGDVSATYRYQKVLKTVASGPQFSWDNAYVYFVMTDRFANGDTSNDNSYGRPKTDATGSSLATFHGGDIKGLTGKLDYIKSLGMNAIWITAPYEQIHGWTGGGDTGAFAHYAYHGYYLLDTTSMDANMGTVEEFRRFVTEAHNRGIRVVLDVVLNHSGYANLQDMCDFNFGATSTGATPCSLASWRPGSGENWHNKPISESQNSAWNNWWGSSWIIFGGYGEQCGAGDGLNACVSYLPDFKNSSPNGSSVTVPPFLQQKWRNSDSRYDVPAALDYRSGNLSVAQFQAKWLAAWVKEFGVDGFRADTAKHVTKETWALLKQEANAALQEWRANTSASDDPAAAWTDDFWMTGEHWGFKTDPTDGSGYHRQGGFDSMINFAFNSAASKACKASQGCCSLPTVDTFSSYAQMYNGGTSSLNALSYLSTHDTSLCRPSGKQQEMGTMLALLPGGVQVYYGDETWRQNPYSSDPDEYEHGTRSTMNFPSDIGSQALWTANVDKMASQFSSDANLAHWQKVGQFRMRNVAVGGGAQTATANALCRTYSKGDIDNAVVIKLGTSSGSSVAVDVGNCFADGTLVQDGYTGRTATVSGGKATFTAGGSVILIEAVR